MKFCNPPPPENPAAISFRIVKLQFNEMFEFAATQPISGTVPGLTGGWFIRICTRISKPSETRPVNQGTVPLIGSAAALFEFGVNPIEFDFEADDTDAFKAPDFTGAKAKTAAAPIAKAASVTMPVKGSLHAAGNTKAARVPALVPGLNTFTQTLDLTVDTEATNGVITVEYDASRFTLDSVRSAASLYTYNDDADNGLVTLTLTVTRPPSPPAIRPPP